LRFGEWAFLPNVDLLLDLGHDGVLVIAHLGDERWLHLASSIDFGTDLLDALSWDVKGCTHAPAPWPLEANGRLLIPDDVARTEHLADAQGKKRIAHRVERSAEVGAVVVPVVVRELHLHVPAGIVIGHPH